MTDFDHIELSIILNSIQGRAVISGYNTSLYDKIFKNWTRIDAPIKTCNSSKGERQESLWLNFVPKVQNG
jgi:DNA adenine methylase